jgi:hypothetical protein
MNIESYLYSNTHPSFKLLFVYLMSENADWIHKNLHEEVPPHPPPKLTNCFLVIHHCSLLIVYHKPLYALAAGSHESNP